ncbi:hypothetical protein [Qipengyuania mesophila]|uniref:hypothetical protein n=2 Tax=Qipengyuania mesophila TaxID=2867246 RepID=UPI003513F5BF
MTMHYWLLGAATLTLSACGSTAEESTSEPDAATVAEVAVIPDSLAPFGEGYPNPGDPCMRLGESAATSNYLDDGSILVGCPTEDAAKVLGGEIVDTVDGVRLVSVAMGDANLGMVSPVDAPSEDALVAGTDYNATAMLDCGFDNKPPTQSCKAGVKRNWTDTPGENLVEVQKPDGRKRAIFFRGTEPFGADSAQADGSAGWDFATSRKGDRVTVRFGPETYVIIDALVEGG